MVSKRQRKSGSLASSACFNAVLCWSLKTPAITQLVGAGVEVGVGAGVEVGVVGLGLAKSAAVTVGAEGVGAGAVAVLLTGRMTMRSGSICSVIRYGSL